MSQKTRGSDSKGITAHSAPGTPETLPVEVRA